MQIFANTRDHNGYNFWPEIRYIINGFSWNRTIRYNQKQVQSPNVHVFLTKLEIIFRWLFHIFKIKLNKDKESLDVLNNINPAIKFTMEKRDKQKPFLDTLINKRRKNVFIDIYSKPPGSKIYVSLKGNHLRYC